MLNDWKMANTFWETFADEITPLVLEDTAFTVDGPYEIKELNVTTAYGEYVLDVGANLGLYACYAANKGCHVYSFDPDERCIEILKMQSC